MRKVPTRRIRKNRSCKHMFSKKYRYPLLHSDTIESQPISSPEDLINFVIGANNKLIDRKEKGWIYAEKIKESRHGEILLYGKRIDLPIFEDNPYFDELLATFHTKKLIPFVELLPSSVSEEEDVLGVDTMDQGFTDEQEAQFSEDSIQTESESKKTLLKQVLREHRQQSKKEQGDV